MGLEPLRHLHSTFSRTDSCDRFFNYTNVSDTEFVSIVGVLLWLRNCLPKLYTRTNPGLPGRHYWRCVTIFLSEILSVYCEGIEPAAPKLT